jgi:hypothetical protein
VPYLDGVTLDADPSSGALTVDNPNPLWLDELARNVQRPLDDEVNPSVAHGATSTYSTSATVWRISTWVVAARASAWPR